MPGKWLDGIKQLFMDADRVTLEHADEEATETAKHFHSYECWWCAAASPSTPPDLTHMADQVANQASTTPFQVNGGDNQYGAWVQILGSEDMPCDPTHTKYDFHEVGIVTVQRANATHWIQFAFGDEPTGEATAGTYSTFFYHPAAVSSRAVAATTQSKRHLNATKVWARCLVNGQNEGTIDFYFGTHGYVV